MIDIKFPSAALLLISFISPISTAGAEPHPSLDPLPGGEPILIAHALGGLNGETYLNCEECFAKSYSQGHRYFEIDLVTTTDHHLVAYHPGFEKRFDLPATFSSEVFMGRKLLGTYSPLDADGVAALLATRSDTKLITDVKSNNEEGLTLLCEALRRRSLSCEDRLVPQLYSFEERKILNRIPFSRTIFTMYRLGKKFAETAAFLNSEPRISSVTFPIDWLDDKKLTAESEGLHIQRFVHTTNDPQAVQRGRALGIDGFYTDVLTPSSLR